MIFVDAAIMATGKVGKKHLVCIFGWKIRVILINSDDHRGGFRGRNRSPSRNFGEKDNPPRDFAKTAGKGFDQVLARQKQQLEKRKLLWQGNKEKKVHFFILFQEYFESFINLNYF